MTLIFDLWPWKSIEFQILLRTKYVPSLVKIHWRMLILECSFSKQITKNCLRTNKLKKNVFTRVFRKALSAMHAIAVSRSCICDNKVKVSASSARHSTAMAPWLTAYIHRSDGKTWKKSFMKYSSLENLTSIINNTSEWVSYCCLLPSE